METGSATSWGGSSSSYEGAHTREEVGYRRRQLSTWGRRRNTSPRRPDRSQHPRPSREPRSRTEVAGHVHVIAGDLTRLACDAWLLPTDGVFRISQWFAPAIGASRDRVSMASRGTGLASCSCRATTISAGCGSATSGAGRRSRPGTRRSSTRSSPRRRPHSARSSTDVAPYWPSTSSAPVRAGWKPTRAPFTRRVLPALYEAADRYDADLVLVCWQRRSYSAAQRVRRRLLKGSHGGDLATLWDLGDRGEGLADEARRIAGELRRRNLVLFVGAGVSAGAGLPAWQGLLDGIAESLGAGGPSRDRLRQLDVRDQAAVLQRRLSATGKTLH